MKKYLRFLVTTGDLFNIFILLIALFLSYVGTLTIYESIDLNSKFPFFLYTTIATLVSSILDPILEIVKVESKKKKLVVISLGTIVSFVTFCYSFYDNSIFDKLQSISKRGGFSAMSVALLLFNLTYINYQLQKMRERELNEQKQKLKTALERNTELEKCVSKLERRTNE
ncbi:MULTISPECIES: hypothetical protein [unclassified Streptococcus]|jgi:hypothetical protein|uniref:hypothetical protein n=1 Tax=unclassified Streptococcus TaxID=2608887 RepID=UPI001566ECF2|nr:MULTISPECIES: hypothetical protein [unclassified Streptococcus]